MNFMILLIGFFIVLPNDGHAASSRSSRQTVTGTSCNSRAGAILEATRKMRERCYEIGYDQPANLVWENDQLTLIRRCYKNKLKFNCFRR